MAQHRLDGRGDEMVIGPGVRLGTALGEAWQRAAFKAVWLLVGNWLVGLFLAWGLENRARANGVGIKRRLGRFRCEPLLVVLSPYPSAGPICWPPFSLSLYTYILLLRTYTGSQRSREATMPMPGIPTPTQYQVITENNTWFVCMYVSV